MQNTSVYIARSCRLIIWAVCFCALFVGAASAVVAQDSSSSAAFPVRLSGSLSLSSEFYDSNGDTGWQPRQGSFVSRGIARATLHIIDQIELPFEVYVSNEETGYRQPFNRFGASPRLFGWLTLHGGYFSSRISELTFGDMQLLGGGVEIAPGKFRLALLHGIAREARELDTTSFFGGEYKRTITAARASFGAESAMNIGFNFARAIDDPNSITFHHIPGDTLHTLLPAPQENITASVNFGFPFIPEVRLQGEVGIAATTEDITAPELDDSDIPDFLLTPRVSTHVDGAAVLGLTITPSSVWSLRLDGRWIGPGFTTLGYPQLQNDVIDGTISPAVRLLDNALYLRASVGIRRTNLRSTKVAATERFLGSFSAGMQFSPAVGIDVSYSNYRMQSAHRNDTLRLDNTFHTASVSPRFSFEGIGGQNTVALSYTFQTVQDDNAVTSHNAENTVHCITAVHSLALPSSWSFGTSAFYNSVEAAVVSTSIITIGETVSKTLFDNALSLSGSLSYSIVGTDTDISGRRISNTDGQLIGRASATYSFQSWGSFSFTLSTGSYTSSDIATRPSHSELRAALGYSVSLQ